MRPISTPHALLCGLLLCTLSVAGGLAHAQDDGLDAYDRGHISVKSYEVKGSDAPKIVVKAVINAPIEKVWDVVSDCRHYKQRFDRIESSRLVKTQGNQHFCEVEIDMPFPLSNLKATTKAIHTESPDAKARRWTLVKGDYKTNTGSWELTKFRGGAQRTFAVYTIHADPNTSVPDWVRTKAQKSALPDMIKRLQKEAKN